MVGNVAGRAVLDLGCGNGGKLIELTRDGAVDSVGIDISGNFLAAPPSLQLVRGDLSESGSIADLTDRKFDRIMFLQSFNLRAASWVSQFIPDSGALCERARFTGVGQGSPRAQMFC
jgi:SAM-dependent methyltransferase